MSTTYAQKEQVRTAPDPATPEVTEVIVIKQGFWSRCWTRVKNFFRAIGRGIKRAALKIWSGICWTGRKGWAGICWVGRKAKGGAKTVGRTAKRFGRWVSRIRIGVKPTPEQQAEINRKRVNDEIFGTDEEIAARFAANPPDAATLMRFSENFERLVAEAEEEAKKKAASEAAQAPKGQPTRRQDARRPKRPPVATK